MLQNFIYKGQNSTTYQGVLQGNLAQEPELHAIDLRSVGGSLKEKNVYQKSVSQEYLPIYRQHLYLEGVDSSNLINKIDI